VSPKPTRPRPSIARNTAFDSVAQGAIMVFSLFAGVVLARSLGDEGRGEYVIATSFAGMLLLGLTNMGVELSASVMVARDRRLLPRLHTLIVALGLGMGAAVGATAWVFRDFFLGTLMPGLSGPGLALLVAALPFWIYQTGCYGLLVGMGRIRARAGFDVAFNLVQNLLVVLLIVIVPRSEVVFALILAYYATIVFSCVHLGMIVRGRRRRLWAMPDAGLARDFLRYGFAVYIGNMGSTLGQRIDQYFVQQVGRDAGAFGVYTLATSLTARTRVFPQALSRSSYARLCAAPAPEAARLAAACFRQMLALGAILLIVGAACSPLIPIIYSADFAPAVVPFLIFLLGRLFHNAAWMLANFFSGHLARPDIPMWINWGILPVQAVAAYFAMKLGGLVAVALITSAGYALLFAVFVVMFLRWQEHVGARELFLLGRADLEPWLRLLTRKK